MLVSISRTNVGATLDPRPSAGSPAFSDVATVPNDGFLTAVNYRGAFGANDLWISGWTALSEYGILTPASQQTVIVNQQLKGTINWTRDNTYQLNGAVFVKSGAVLNIEAGTVIKGNNLGTFGTNVAALYVCRGAKIMAEGTAQHPIIFTSITDDVTIPDDLSITQRGLWGGVIVFGRTTINGALNVAGNAASPKYEVYEGMEDLSLGDEFVFRFGGTDDNDSSGVMRYVSIRHGGAKLSADKEINGLSLGAVGRGTTIDFVEAYAIADDGFEFFGGTVNTKHLVSAFCDDDGFDTDMGYRGVNQFWFGIQAPDARNYGMELNNQINEIATSEKLLPASGFKVYNATLIGAGTSSTLVNGGRNAAIIFRPFLGVTIENSIFTDFNERAIELDTRNTISAANVVTNTGHLKNNLWWGFVTGSGSANVNNTITNISRNTIASNYWSVAAFNNQIANPLLVSISRTNVGATLDPRPQADSPALSDVALTPIDGFLTTVNYRGAFAPGQGNWLAGWTALSEYQIVTGNGGIHPIDAPTGAVVPTQPSLAIARVGGVVRLTVPTQSNVSYQVQSCNTLGASAVWVNEGSTVSGTGSPVTVDIAQSSTTKFIRVVTQ